MSADEDGLRAIFSRTRMPQNVNVKNVDHWSGRRETMITARYIVALLRSHIDGDEERFLSVATQLAAHEARQGMARLRKSSAN